MKVFIILSLFSLTVCNSCNTVVDSQTNLSKDNCDYFLISDSVDICLTVTNVNTNEIKFALNFNTSSSQNISGIANLILLEEENGELYVPEGTAILDKISKNEYLCDSTYQYDSDKINFSFGFEELTKKRLSLVVYNSKIPAIKNDEYTLYKRN